ncbi:Oidioi.mRNA.OKI2018_I69.XSR.g14917.t1.cds [Oikopleura dioica]|uniref:Oidioi.mRNA.OKI2018_I69.XSR.g14917.t1.cds n=1 Tax=Oikopleura dioica TaxID=34765 RepID=A0ABN7SCY8_OIKDI|nr:Oidioi.mRNA.OKI2018_I69.XSR.g14917.t1.cds [Oikopleura dioica]
MAEFSAPEIQVNANGWGPCQVPEKFKDMPYQPFGKTDRLGKVSDWTGATYTDRKYANKYTSTFASNHQYTYYYEDDDTSYENPVFDKRRDASVKVGEDWNILREIDFSQLATLRMNELPRGEDLYTCGSVEAYDSTYDRITPKNERPMKKSSADRNFNTCADTTTDDPIIRESRHKGQVFATDHILATLMTAGRSVIPWDIIVRRIGDKLFFDKRATSNIDKISVNETANDPPSEENNTGINDPRNLTLEATYVNKVFGQQCLRQGEWTDLANKNPYIDPGMKKDRIASAGYRYRKWTLGEYTLVARTTVDAVVQNKKTGAKGFAIVRALNEWDSKMTGDWRKKLEQQPGAVLATEMKNNNCKLAKWTCQAVMAGAVLMKLAYISRNSQRNNREHSVLQVSQFTPSQFAAQMQLQLENSWAVLRAIIHECMQLSQGKYLLLKDPNNQKLILYSIPEDTFSSSEDESSDDDEGSNGNIGQCNMASFAHANLVDFDCRHCVWFKRRSTKRLLNQQSPTFQSFGTYVLIALVYIPVYIYKTETSFSALTALIDFEANYTIVKAYQYTSITSVQMLDSATLFFVFVFSLIFLQRKYSKIHYLLIVVVLGGVALMIYADVSNSPEDGIGAEWLGSVLVIIACFLYATSNTAMEYIVKHSQNGTLMPVAFFLTSAVFTNLGLLTADVYALIFGIFVFDENFDYFYLISYFVIFGGLLGFHIETWRFEKRIKNEPKDAEDLVQQNEENDDDSTTDSRLEFAEL